MNALNFVEELEDVIASREKEYEEKVQHDSAVTTEHAYYYLGITDGMKAALELFKTKQQ